VARDATSAVRLEPKLVKRLYQQANAARWGVSEAQFAASMQASAERMFASQTPSRRELDRYLSTLHLEDLALACACAGGVEAAWEHFVLQHRPVLYRAADALDPSGGTREIADSLYAELYGLPDRAGVRQSLFRYFHGRSSLGTWLRAVLAQRHVDRIRSQHRIEPLPDDPPAISAPRGDPDRRKYLSLIHRALRQALTRLPDRDRLRLGLYYAQQLTLAEAGRVLNEHEATVSRQLARTRTAIRKDLELQLRADGLTEQEIGRCFECVAEDAGPLDLRTLLEGGVCKPAEPNRSI
jgi:RNA polymerase sigma-70 factor (ECF subfamily)